MRTTVFALLLALLLFGCGREEGRREAAAPARDGKGARPAVFAVNPEGFGGIPWGASATGLPQLIPAAGGEAEGGEALYSRRDEVESLAGVAVARVEYRFRAGRFARAVVYFSGEQQGQALKQALFADYGAVGPFMAASPVSAAAVPAFKQYSWQFERGAAALFLDTTGKNHLLVFAADAAGLTGGPVQGSKSER